jgi:branched-chain amino acid aminotransferase
VSVIYLNGSMVDSSTARIDPADRGFTLGDGVFETMRVANGRVFRLGDHLHRLADAARRTGIPLPAGIAAAVHRTVSANDVADGGARITLTRGRSAPGLRTAGSSDPTLLITVFPYRASSSLLETGARAILSRGRLNPEGLAAGLKHVGYMEAILAQREADAAGVDEAILLDTRGNLAEAAAANLFLVRSGELLTPSLACGVLPGITRAIVIALASSAGARVREGELRPAELRGAGESFLTSSLRGIVPLVEVDGRAIGDGRAGALTRRIQAAHADLVLNETGARVVHDEDA